MIEHFVCVVWRLCRLGLDAMSHLDVVFAVDQGRDADSCLTDVRSICRDCSGSGVVRHAPSSPDGEVAR